MKKRIFFSILIFSIIFSASICKPKPIPEKVWISVCSDFPDLPPAQAKIANPYCPSHLAQYLKSNQPTEICTKHVKPEPVIPQCDIPWPETHKLLIWEGTLLCFLSTEENPEFTPEGVISYADAIAVDGVNCIRSFSFFLDEIPGYWESWKPVDEEYRTIVQTRLKLLSDRKITAIVSLEPYGGMATDSEINWIIDTCVPFLPYVIFETANESGDMNLHRRLIAMLKAKGIQNKNIMLYYVDSGDFADCLVNELAGEGLASLHGVGSMETINAPWPNGWSTSPGTLALMAKGLTGSNDGDDYAKAAKGLFWPWLIGGPGQRSTAEQGHDITLWYLQNGGRGWEFLSAAGFQQHGPNQKRPDLLGAVELGREERRAMRRAYQEVVQ
jgi:hypothetical protein